MAPLDTHEWSRMHASGQLSGRVQRKRTQAGGIRFWAYCNEYPIAGPGSSAEAAIENALALATLYCEALAKGENGGDTAE